MAPQTSRAVVMCPKALEDVSVSGVVVLKRKVMKELKEGLGEDHILRLFHLKFGHWKDLMHSEKLGVL